MRFGLQSPNVVIVIVKLRSREAQEGEKRPDAPIPIHLTQLILIRAFEPPKLALVHPHERLSFPHHLIQLIPILQALPFLFVVQRFQELRAVGGVCEGGEGR